MDDLGLGSIGVAGKFIGTVGGAIVTMLYLARKFLLADKVQSATAQGNVDVIESLKALADRAEKREAMAVERANLAEKRADDAYKERNEAYREIGALREQVKYLTEMVEQLKVQLNAAKAS